MSESGRLYDKKTGQEVGEFEGGRYYPEGDQPQSFDVVDDTGRPGHVDGYSFSHSESHGSLGASLAGGAAANLGSYILMAIGLLFVGFALLFYGGLFALVEHARWVLLVIPVFFLVIVIIRRKKHETRWQSLWAVVGLLVIAGFCYTFYLYGEVMFMSDDLLLEHVCDTVEFSTQQINNSTDIWVGFTLEMPSYVPFGGRLDHGDIRSVMIWLNDKLHTVPRRGGLRIPARIWQPGDVTVMGVVLNRKQQVYAPMCER